MFTYIQYFPPFVNGLNLIYCIIIYCACILRYLIVYNDYKHIHILSSHCEQCDIRPHTFDTYLGGAYTWICIAQGKVILHEAMLIGIYFF